MAKIQLAGGSSGEPDNSSRQQSLLRCVVFVIMLAFVYVANLMMHFDPHNCWFFCQGMALLFALIALWQYWFVHRGLAKSGIMLWHQLLHWVGLLLVTYVVAFWVSSGAFNVLQAGFCVYILLTLSLFLSGVYTDPGFMLIGVTMCVLPIVALIFPHYMALWTLLVVLVAVVVLLPIVYFPSLAKLKVVE